MGWEERGGRRRGFEGVRRAGHREESREQSMSREQQSEPKLTPKGRSWKSENAAASQLAKM
jgi:hypothetical protein